MKNEARRGRSFELKALILALAALSLLGWLRLQQALFLWDILNEYGIQPPPIYFAISGAVWGSAALAAAVSLFLRLRWAGWYTLGMALGIALWYWIDRLFLSQPPATQADLPFAVVFTLLCLAFTAGVLALHRQRYLFGK
jgi:hypothetical protein